MSSSKNLEYQKTSFLSKTNSSFIEEMYFKFINQDKSLPESWKRYFEDIGEDLNVVAKELNGPSWNSNKKKIDVNEIQNNLDYESNVLEKTEITQEQGSFPEITQTAPGGLGHKN